MALLNRHEEEARQEAAEETQRPEPREQVVNLYTQAADLYQQTADAYIFAYALG